LVSGNALAAVRRDRFVSGRYVLLEEPGQQDQLAIRSVEPQRLTAIRAGLPFEKAIRRDHAASGREGVFEGRPLRYRLGSRIDGGFLGSINEMP
jgi:hypothetical protein